jgi:DNA-binding XRE family transcriptional regulator
MVYSDLVTMSSRTDRKRNKRVAGKRASPRGTLTLLGKELRRQRKKRGLTQIALSVNAGYSQNVVGLIERGIYNPTVVMLTDIAMSLGIPPGHLLTNIDSLQSWLGLDNIGNFPTGCITELRWRRV